MKHDSPWGLKPALRLVLVASLACLAACATRSVPTPNQDAARASPAASAPAAPGASRDPMVSGSPSVAESALAQGIKSYQAGKYQMAETQLRLALKEGLTVPADLANAHKHLAFIYCTSQRESACRAAFKSARAADPAFALSKTESGHPMWARTYKKAMEVK